MRSIRWVVSGLICGGLWVGCGGDSSRKHDAGSGGGAGRAAESGAAGTTGGSASGGAGGGGGAGATAAGETATGGAHEIPTKDGLPIGDCTEPTAGELAALGCPAVLEYMAPCTQVGAVCRSEIRTNEGHRSHQAYSRCQENGQLDVGVTRTCGFTCEGSAGNDATLDARDCGSRPARECDTSFVTYSAPPLAQEQADHELEKVLIACGARVIDNRIEVKLKNGCPYALSTTPTLSSSAVDCLKATLSDVRWSCAEDLACVSWAMFFT
jgi:hypothetical protein